MNITIIGNKEYLSIYITEEKTVLKIVDFIPECVRWGEYPPTLLDFPWFMFKVGKVDQDYIRWKRIWSIQKDDFLEAFQMIESFMWAKNWVLSRKIYDKQEDNF